MSLPEPLLKVHRIECSVCGEATYRRRGDRDRRCASCRAKRLPLPERARAALAEPQAFEAWWVGEGDAAGAVH